MSVRGRWRIAETELWDSEALDLVAPAFIEFGEDGSGSFGFIAVQGEMDCREVVRDGRPGVEFSWEGNDECDPASGRGWAVLHEDGSLRGRIFFHLGDDSGLRQCASANHSPGTRRAGLDRDGSLLREAPAHCHENTPRTAAPGSDGPPEY